MRWLLLAGVLLGCSKDHIAELRAHQGAVQRDSASTKEHWESASDGAKLSLGDGLKTGAQAGATVHLTAGGNIAVSSDTTIRFVNGVARPKLAIETGEASIDAEDKPLTLETTIGLAQIEPGGRLRLSATRVEVTVGAAHLETEDGGVSLSPGHAFDISLGGAILEHEDAGVPDASVPIVDASIPTGEIAVDVHGAGTRRQAKGESAWKSLAEGAATIAAGDALDVANGGTVDVRQGGRHAHLVGAGRFVIGDGAAFVNASAGHVDVEATTEEIVVQVPGGVIVAKTTDGKSRLAADVSASTTSVAVLQGQGEVRGKSGSETVRAGESGTVTTKGVITASNRGAAQSDFTVHAGESVVVRDPHPPTMLGIDVAPVCPSGAVLSRSRGTVTARGDHRLALGFPEGLQAYEIHCLGPDGVDEKPVATGTITIIGDSGRAELPRLPPSTVVDTDGRRYTVLYQNLLPAVVARWPGAPPATGYELVVDKERTKSPTAQQSLKSIGEGTHTLSFQTEDGTKKSGETTLVIKFDNAAPVVSVRDPVDGSFQPGDTVKVTGVAVEGWTVSINGTAVPLDEQKRFSTTAVVPAGETSLALKLSNPKHGTVYYVRHAGIAKP